MRAFFKGFVFAWSGLSDFFRHHRNGKVQAVAALCAVGLGWYLGIKPLEWALVAGCIGLVLALEAMNTAVEYLTDLVSPDYHPLAGKVKDMAAGAVLLAAIAAAVVGGLVFTPYLMPFLYEILD